MNKAGTGSQQFRGLLIAATVLIGLTAVFVILGVSRRVLVLPDTLVALKAPWTASVSASWEGSGTLYGHFETGDPMEQYSGWMQGSSPPTGPFGNHRSVLVYLPPGYNPDRSDAYPVLYALHGFGRRPDVWVESLLPLVEEAILNGTMPPSIVIMPDFSISGNGSADGPWPGDGRAGSWYVDSNLGRYEKYFFDELIPWMNRTYNTRTDPAGTALLGTSMGGFGALYYSIVREDFASTVAAVYPAADLRYSVSGSRLSAFEAERYSPIDNDRPRRAMMALGGSDFLGISEEFFLYQVFGADSTEGDDRSIWPGDMPVWMRLQSVNPVDILDSETPDLTAGSFYLVAGDQDEFYFDDHLPIIESALKRHGAEVTVEILSGLEHGWWGDGNESHRRKVVRWLGEELQDSSADH